MKNKNVEIQIIISFLISAILVVAAGLTDTFVIYYIVAVFLILIGYYILSIIKKHLNTILALAKKIEKGEFDTKNEIHLNGKFGDIQEALHNLAGNFEKQILNIIIEAHRLSAVYSEIQIMINDFSHKAETMNQTSGSVASATEELSVNTKMVSKTTQKTSDNISVVSSNTEEMTSTVNEISTNTEKTREVAQQAVKSVGQATEKVSELGKKAIEIGKVIDVIEDISDQTKLLALNATIEAARAGEAGKGFAVVANEVKELASQTALATDDIKKSVFEIQDSSTKASQEIEKINNIINQVEENISSIATAVEEQNVTTRDIAGHIDNVAEGMKEVTQNISQSSEASRMIAMDMGKVSVGSKQILEDSVNINGQIKNLKEISSNLEGLGNIFSFTAEKQNQITKIVELAKLLQARESDHLNWVKNVQNAVTEQAESINVQKDPTLCGMGKFLDSSARIDIGKQNPKMAQIFASMDEPHRKLHKSAIQLEEMLKDSDISNIEIENCYNSTTVRLLRELLQLFHQAVNENFRSFNY